MMAVESVDQMSDEVWKRLADIDPYWGVLSMDKFRGELSAERKAEFFALGEGAVDHMMNKASELRPNLGLDLAVDFGCGVGRLSRALAKRFDRVISVDISQTMLDLCVKNAGEVGRVQPVLSDDTLSGLAGVHADFIISSITFQHIRSSRGLPLIERLFEHLKPGGVLVLFLLIAGRPDLVSREPGQDQIESSAESFIEMNVYPADQVLQIASRFATEVRLELVRTGAQLGADLYAMRSL